MMAGTRELPGEPAAFWHRSLWFGSDDEFTHATLPVIQDGLDADDQVLVVTTQTNIALLRDRLPGGGGDVDFVVSSEWYKVPPRTLAAYDDYVRDHEKRNKHVRILGEPHWGGRTPLQRRAWQRYESLINLAFADRDVAVTCLYDTRTADQGILEGARHTHPVLADSGGSRPCSDYVDPREFCAACDAEPLPDPPGSVAELEFGESDGLGAVRVFANDQAEQAGMSAERAVEVVFAVNEIATNAFDHGGGRGRLRAWQEGHELVFEVADDGGGAPDPLAGQLRPSADARGWGLWTARQLCELVEIRHGSGWLVRAYADLREQG